MSVSQSEGSIYISRITLDVRQKFNRAVDHIVFSIGGAERVILGGLSPGGERGEVYNPALTLSPQDQLSVSIRYQSRWWLLGKRTLRITIKQSEIKKEALDDGHGKKKYVKFHNNILLTIGVSRDMPASDSFHGTPSPAAASESPPDTLFPTTSEILRICPRFRLLIIGNSGVGKSTLIQKVFGVNDVNVSESSRGQADIDREFVAADNNFFVIHDSLGLEAGEGSNLEKVKRFIEERRRKEDVKDRLHAVWVCLAVPYAKGRLLEAGMEDFLRDRRKILGDIPIVVVLTKFDLLDNSLLQKLRGEGTKIKSIEEAQPQIEPRRAEFIEKYCTKPLLLAAKGNIPRIAVSTRAGYKLEPTISALVKITTFEIEQYIKANLPHATTAGRPSIERNAPLYVAGMAQRASIEAKVDLTIELGKKRYWSNLGASFRFSNDKVREYLLVILQDVIQVWNFNDPEMALQGDSFKVALLDTSNLGVQDIQNGTAALAPVMPLVSTLGTLIDGSFGAAVALPVAGAVLLVQLCHEIYKATKTIVKRFMAYIVDLVYVMKILFILAPQGSVTPEDVALALEVYKKSTYKNRVHLEIHDFNAGFAILPGGRDLVVEKIVVLIERYSITDEEVSRVRGQIRAQGSAQSTPASS